MAVKRTQRRKRQKPVPVNQVNTTVKRKLAGLFIVVMLALVGLAVRITYVNATNGDQYARIVLSNNQQQYVSNIIPYKRGDILDRNGTILATSERVYNVILDCKVANYVTKDDNGNRIQPYKEPTIHALVQVFGISEEDLRERLDSERTKESQYQVVMRNVTMEEKEYFESYENPAKGTVSDKEYAERLKINGVWFEQTYQRVYPQKSQACDLIGFTYNGNEASWGIEGYYTQILNGVNGRKFSYYNSESEVEMNIIEPTNGKNVVSTCDINIQEICRSAIEKFMATYANGPNGNRGAKNVAVLVMNPKNGEILAMDSTDWYDLNNPRDLRQFYTAAEIEEMTNEQARDNLNRIWRNFCVSDAFEPGSTYKPMVTAAALDTGAIDGTESYYCDGFEMINGQMIRCSVYPSYHGKLSPALGLTYSCNDVMMHVGDALGAENFLKYQEIYKYGMRTGIDLPGENAGVLYSIEGLGDIELASASFGQGFTCTMVQNAAAFSSVINGGYYYKPHVVRNITDKDGNVVESMEPVLVARTTTESTSAYIRKALGWTVEFGTGTGAKVTGYSMGGKTGTAQKIPRDSGNYLVSFIGFAPLDDPQVLVYVIVDEPNITDQAQSGMAQTIAKNIMTELLPYLGIYPENQDSNSREARYKDETGTKGENVAVPPEQTESDEVINGGNDIFEEGLDNEMIEILGN